MKKDDEGKRERALERGTPVRVMEAWQPENETKEIPRSAVGEKELKRKGYTRVSLEPPGD